MPHTMDRREPDLESHAYVLITGSQAKAWHIPDPDPDSSGEGADRPLCGAKLRRRREFQRREPTTLPDRLTPCKFCHGQVAQTAEETGGYRWTARQIRARARELEPDFDLDLDLDRERDERSSTG